MNKFVPYHAESVEYAKKITAGDIDPLKKYKRITSWVNRCIAYDYIRAITIPKRGKEYPDVEGCWNKRMGICMDVASMTVGMLRAVGIESYLCYGHADNAYHAWVESVIKGKRYRFDHRGKAKKYTREKVY